MSWEVIIPFLRPIEPLIRDSKISEIMVNPPGRVFVEEEGLIREVTGVTLEEKALQVGVKNIARAFDDEISEERPILDSRLPDGSRVAAVFPPCSVGGAMLTIRKFNSKKYTAEELLRIGSLTPEVLERLQTAVASHQNILISGGTGTGKTTLLSALTAFISSNERVVLIEETPEIQIERAHLVRLAARREQPDRPAVSIRDLLRATLRHRPDRILLGEVRGGEAFDLLQALNTGHAGTLSTLHANSARHALSRIVTCFLQSGIELPYLAIRSNIADGIDLLVHVDRWSRKRCVTEVIRVKRYDPSEDRYDLETIYERPRNEFTKVAEGT